MRIAGSDETRFTGSRGSISVNDAIDWRDIWLMLVVLEPCRPVGGRSESVGSIASTILFPVISPYESTYGLKRIRTCQV